MKRKETITVDLKLKQYNPIVLKQFDTTELELIMLDNSLNVNLSELSIYIIFTKPNGTIVIQNSKITKKDNVINAILKEACLRLPGKANIEVELKKDTEIVSSFYIPVVIEKSSKENIESDNTPNYVEILENASAEEEKRIAAENNRVNAEQARTTAEGQRQTAETTRTTAETARSNAEQLRTTAEKQRQAAETNRTTTETARSNAEQARATAENNRVTEFEAMMSNVNAQQVQQNKNDIINLKEILPKNAGSHNGKYRGKDITSLFYAGTLTTQIAAGTFDDIFIGDYIIGKVSGRKYLVADINYRLHCGDTECTRNHVLLVPERTMGNAQMNTSNITTGGYYGSAMYTTNLAAFKTIIQNDFGIGHILSHKELLTNAVTDGKASGWAWYDSTIELMNESMVYGHNVWGSHPGYETGIDKSQLSLFRLRPDLIPARDTSGGRTWYWLRDVVSSSNFAHVYRHGNASAGSASGSSGVRPAFLIY